MASGYVIIQASIISITKNCISLICDRQFDSQMKGEKLFPRVIMHTIVGGRGG